MSPFRCHGLPPYRRVGLALVAGVALILAGLPAAAGTATAGNVECDRPGTDDRCETWVATYDNPNGHGQQQNGRDLVEGKSAGPAVSPDGKRVYVTGMSWDNTTGHYDWATAAVDAETGTQLWATRYNGTNGLDDVAHAIAVSPDGERVYVTGIENICYTCSQEELESGKETIDRVTTAYDAATGRQLWAVSQGGRAPDGVGFSPLAVSADGKQVFVAGDSCTTADFETCGFVTTAYDAASGQEKWSVRYDGAVAGQDLGRAIVASPDSSRVYVTGPSVTDPLPADEFSGGQRAFFATVAYNAATGAQVWVSEYRGEASESGGSGNIGISPDGSAVFVGGVKCTDGVFPGDDCDLATVAYDAATGSERWTARYAGRAGERQIAQLNDLTVSPTGDRVYVTGSDADVSSDAVTISYDAASGQQAWAATYTGIAPDTDERGQSVRVSPDGSQVYIASSSPNDSLGNSHDFATVAYASASGSQVWVARYNSSPDGTHIDESAAVGVSPDGSRVYTAGTFNYYQGRQRPDNEADYAVLAYDAAGSTGESPPETCPRSKGAEGNHVVGTPGNDILEGTPGPDVICGLGGNDSIDARGGDDVILGGRGIDLARGGGGNDSISAGGGNDNARGGAGDDDMFGRTGNDSMLGGGGRDAIKGNKGLDTLHGNRHDDTLEGGDGDDLLNGNQGDDTLRGGDHDDDLNGGRGSDACRGGGGRDTERNCE